MPPFCSSITPSGLMPLLHPSFIRIRFPSILLTMMMCRRFCTPLPVSSRPPNKAMRSIVHIARLYKNSIPNTVKEEIEHSKNDAKLTKNCIPDHEVTKEFEALILDPGYSRGRKSLHMKTMDYLWQHKFVLGRELVDRGEAHDAILLKLDELSNNM